MQSSIGSEVRISGVKAKPHLNGTVGVVVSYSAANGRFGVRTSSGAMVALRPDVLLTVNEDLPPRPPPATDAAAPSGLGQGGDVVTLWLVVADAGVPILAEDGTELGRARCGEVFEAYLATGVTARLDPSEAARLLTCGSGINDDEDEEATMVRFMKQHAVRSKHWARQRHWDVKASIRTVGVERFGGRSGGPSGQLWFVRSRLEGALLPPPTRTPPTRIPSVRTMIDDVNGLNLDGGGEACESARPLLTLRDALSDVTIDSLVERGYVVLDGILPPSLCSTLREEMDGLEMNGQMWPSKTYAASDGAAHLHVHETSLEYKDARAHAPTFDAIERDASLLDAVRSRVPGLAGLDSQHLRIQINAGEGGCYSMHTDAGRDVELGDVEGSALVGGQTLRLTALFYVSRGWAAGDGGELRLYPYPHGSVQVAPLEGRLVIFEPRLVHDVAPNFKRRYCFTLWCSVYGAPSDSAIEHALVHRMEVLPALDEAATIAEAWRRTRGLHVGFGQSLPRALRALFLPELRMILVRVTSADAEIAMIKQSHADTPELQSTLDDIAFHHECMRASNPRWLLELLNALPKLAAERGAVDVTEGAEGGSDGGGVLRLTELRALADAMCPWWTHWEKEPCAH